MGKTNNEERAQWRKCFDSAGYLGERPDESDILRLIDDADTLDKVEADVHQLQEWLDKAGAKYDRLKDNMLNVADGVKVASEIESVLRNAERPIRGTITVRRVDLVRWISKLVGEENDVA